MSKGPSFDVGKESWGITEIPEGQQLSRDDRGPKAVWVCDHGGGVALKEGETKRTFPLARCHEHKGSYMYKVVEGEGETTVTLELVEV